MKKKKVTTDEHDIIAESACTPTPDIIMDQKTPPLVPCRRLPLYRPLLFGLSLDRLCDTFRAKGRRTFRTAKVVDQFAEDQKSLRILQERWMRC